MANYAWKEVIIAELIFFIILQSSMKHYSIFELTDLITLNDRGKLHCHSLGKSEKNVVLLAANYFLFEVVTVVLKCLD